MNRFQNDEEVLSNGFTKEELERAKDMHETDFNKDFFITASRDEQTNYLFRARYRIQDEQRKCILCDQGIEHSNCTTS